jgi:hypothetical protein
MSLRSASLLVAGLALSASSAHATVYGWNWTPSSPQPVGGSYAYSSAGGSIESINAQYDNASKELTFDVKFNGTLTTRGLWLVMNGGPNPKSQPGEYAIFYFDAQNFAAPKLTTYVYNGLNAGSSWNDGNGPASGSPAGDLVAAANSGYVKSISAGDSGGKRTFSFKIDATSILGHNPDFDAPDGSPWFGTGFGQKLGIWMHTLRNLTMSYNGDGTIKTFSYDTSKEGYLDGEKFMTTTIPAPGAAAMLGFGGLLVARRRRSN